MQPEIDFQWPKDYVLTALWFLAVDDNEKLAYLPGIFPVTPFDSEGGIYETTSPLFFMLDFCRQRAIAGCLWDEWDETQPYDSHRRDLFERLHATTCALLDLAPAMPRRSIMPLHYGDRENPWISHSLEARRVARLICTRMDLGDPSKFTPVPALTLLRLDAEVEYPWFADDL